MGLSIDWVMVSEEVRGALRCRRVPADVSNEVTQAAVVKALAEATPAWTTADAIAWSVRVALNLHVDEHRRSARVQVGAVPDVIAAMTPVEDVVAARLELEDVTRAMAHLSDGDRELLLDLDALPPPTRREQVRKAVARHRARERLRDALRSFGAWVGTRPAARRALGVVEASPALRDALAAATVATTLMASIAAAGVAPMPETLATSFQGLGAGVRADVDAASLDGLFVPPAETARPSPDKRRHLLRLAPGAERPGWAEPGDAPKVLSIDPDGDESDGSFFWWEDDEEKDDEPLACVWSAPAGEVCTSATWGDARDVAPVPLPDSPW